MPSPQPAGLAVLVTAAGRSERFGGGKKELVRIEGRSVLDRAVSPFLSLDGLRALAITAPPGMEEEVRSSLSRDSLDALESRLGSSFIVTAGGGDRRDSVRMGLEALALSPGLSGLALDEVVVLVHDGARPWASRDLAARVAQAALERGAAVPVVPLVDTPKQIDAAGLVSGHPRRSDLAAAQTPQGFRFGGLLEAHRRAAAEGYACTDDTELWARYKGAVASVPGEPGNRKLTRREDLPTPAALPFRIGQGWDLHRLVPNRRLLVGGVVLPFELGEDGHSDGDVLFHAVIDALLGAAALGDIGSHFPPGDEAWRGADSSALAREAVSLVRASGWEPGNLDCTVVLERPRLGPSRDEIRSSLARALGMELGSVSVKAKTKEGVDAAGEGRAIEAYASVTLFRRPGF
ncbi:MAG TPA: 2-C-methyl-D-erythritol 2,4-cyclodiphosphate synthase [Rectinemataceae bacterium]|nr:2-C-methyl-D-erythritol 2,4-cyclodiphosphate synthase [Rectinemataceae bacterium]